MIIFLLTVVRLIMYLLVAHASFLVKKKCNITHCNSLFFLLLPLFFNGDHFKCVHFVRSNYLKITQETEFCMDLFEGVTGDRVNNKACWIWICVVFMFFFFFFSHREAVTLELFPCLTLSLALLPSPNMKNKADWVHQAESALQKSKQLEVLAYSNASLYNYENVCLIYRQSG